MQIFEAKDKATEISCLDRLNLFVITVDVKGIRRLFETQ